MAWNIKPDKTPRFATGGSAAVAEPTEGKKDLGWVAEKPPHQWMNWLHEKVYEWNQFIHANLGNVFGRASFDPLLALNLALPGYVARETVVPVGIAGNQCTYALGFIWMTDTATNLVKIDPSDNSVVATYNLFSGPHEVVFDGTHLWVVNRSGGGSVAQFDPSTGTILNTVVVAGNPQGACFDGTHIWTGND
ncbi:MAG: hypothetical protein KAT00_14365, partial [Planctomycetes bacterium]|nr:hypothetical protein [Planctomycetota bacterium]